MDPILSSSSRLLGPFYGFKLLRPASSCSCLLAPQLRPKRLEGKHQLLLPLLPRLPEKPEAPPSTPSWLVAMSLDSPFTGRKIMKTLRSPSGGVAVFGQAPHSHLWRNHGSQKSSLEARSLPQIPGVLCMKHPPQLSLDQGLEEIAQVISPFKRVHPHLSKPFSTVRKDLLNLAPRRFLFCWFYWSMLSIPLLFARQGQRLHTVLSLPLCPEREKHLPGFS